MANNNKMFKLGFAKGINSRKNILKVYVIHSRNKLTGENYYNSITAKSKKEALDLLKMKKGATYDELQIISIKNYD